MQSGESGRADAPVQTGPIQYASILLLWALVAVTFYQFFTRYILNDSAAWTEEIAQYGLALIVFIGSVIVSRKNGHIRMIILQSLLPERARYVLVLISALIEVALIIVLFVLSLRMLPHMHGERMVFADVPMSLIYAGIALFLGIHALVDLRRIFAMRRYR